MRHPTAARATLPPGQFENFTELSRVHADGWGMAWAPDTPRHGIDSSTSPRSAASDPRYHELANRPLGDAGLVHLRWASDGLAVRPENTHPFVEGGLALAHNGSIHPIERLDELLDAPFRRGLQGTTDSERYFRLILQERAATDSDVAAVQQAVSRLLNAFQQASFNALVLTHDQLIAVHASRQAPTPLGDLEELFPEPRSAPIDHVEAYFQMRYRQDADGVVVTSTGLSQPDWIDMPHNSMLVVERHTCRSQVLDLPSPVDAVP